MNFKKIIWILAALVTSSLPAASAEPPTPTTPTTPRNTKIFVSPFGLTGGALNFGAEFAAAPQFSVGPVTSYSRISSDSQTASTLGLGAQATYSPGGNAFSDGMFVSPFLLYSRATANGESASGVIWGIDFGYGWFWDGGLHLALGGGFQQIQLDLTSIGLTNVSFGFPSLKCQMGWAW